MFDSTFAAVMLTGLAACGVTTLGIHLVSRHERWARRHSIHFIAFAGGMLLTVSLLHIVPKALGHSDWGPALMLGGFLSLYALNRLLHVYLCKGEDDAAPLGVIPMLGIGLHSFVDGWIYSVMFSVDAFTGVLAAIGMVLHELPEGAVVYVALDRGRYRGRRARTYAFLAAAATTPVGALIAYPIAHRVSGPVLGGMLAVSAGALLYVGASHLLPQVEQEHRPASVVLFAGGVATAVAIVLLGH